jgi:SAM-dependent methyltransferase
MVLSKFSPINGSSRMTHAGDIQNSRKTYVSGINKNLNWLLRSRFVWMNEYLKLEDIGLELGSGIAASKDFIKCRNFTVSDYLDSDWLDLRNVNALDTGFSPSSFDFIIISNTIHHLAFPKKFFQEAHRLLKPNGRLIIQDIYTSLCMRILLNVTKHEGYNEIIDVFSEKVPCNESHDPWSANCSIPKLLFKFKDKFNKELPNWEIIHYKNVEFLSFANSGGVIAKTKHVNLSPRLLALQDSIDKFLCWALPEIFSLQVQIVLRKKL